MIFMFAFSLAICYDSSVGGIRTTAGSDVREGKAFRALEEARDFDRQSHGTMRDLVARKYMSIVRIYPGTQAAREAALMYERVIQSNR